MTKGKRKFLFDPASESDLIINLYCLKRVMPTAVFYTCTRIYMYKYSLIIALLHILHLNTDPVFFFFNSRL